MKSAVLRTRRGAPSRARRGAAPPVASAKPTAKENREMAGQKSQLKSNHPLGKAVAKANHQAGSKVRPGDAHPLDVLPNVASFGITSALSTWLLSWCS